MVLALQRYPAEQQGTLVSLTAPVTLRAARGGTCSGAAVITCPLFAWAAAAPLSLTARPSILRAVLEEYKSELRSLQTRADARKTSQGPLTKEQLLELQQQLFAQARERTLSEPSPTTESEL